jgi:hypothetical protein
MGAPFFAMIPLHTVALVMLYSGLALSLTASALYIRSGVAELGRRRREPPPPEQQQLSS